VKRFLLLVIVVVLALLGIHILLGLNRSFAFAILDRGSGKAGGLIDRYLLDRCSDHRLLVKSTSVNIRGNASAEVDTVTNEIFFKETVWVGSSKSVTEYVLILDNAVHPYDRKPGFGVVVVFTPQRISFIDFRNRDSGYFRREEPGRSEIKGSGFVVCGYSELSRESAASAPHLDGHISL